MACLHSHNTSTGCAGRLRTGCCCTTRARCGDLQRVLRRNWYPLHTAPYWQQPRRSGMIHVPRSNTAPQLHNHASCRRCRGARLPTARVNRSRRQQIRKRTRLRARHRSRSAHTVVRISPPKTTARHIKLLSAHALRHAASIVAVTAA
jgi:hypothetical protein